MRYKIVDLPSDEKLIYDIESMAKALNEDEFIEQERYEQYITG